MRFMPRYHQTRSCLNFFIRVYLESIVCKLHYIIRRRFFKTIFDKKSNACIIPDDFHIIFNKQPPLLSNNRLLALVLHNKISLKNAKNSLSQTENTAKGKLFYAFYSFLSKSKTTLSESSLSLALNGLPDLDIKSSSSVVSPCKMRFAEVKVMRAPKTLAPNLNLQPLL